MLARNTLIGNNEFKWHFGAEGALRAGTTRHRLGRGLSVTNLIPTIFVYMNIIPELKWRQLYWFESGSKCKINVRQDIVATARTSYVHILFLVFHVS